MSVLLPGTMVIERSRNVHRCFGPDNCAHTSTFELHSLPLPSVWAASSLCCLVFSVLRNPTLSASSRRLATGYPVTSSSATHVTTLPLRIRPQARLLSSAVRLTLTCDSTTFGTLQALLTPIDRFLATCTLTVAGSEATLSLWSWCQCQSCYLRLLRHPKKIIDWCNLAESGPATGLWHVLRKQKLHGAASFRVCRYQCLH